MLGPGHLTINDSVQTDSRFKATILGRVCLTKGQKEIANVFIPIPSPRINLTSTQSIGFSVEFINRFGC